MGPFTFQFDKPLLWWNVGPVVTDGVGNSLGQVGDVEIRLSPDRRSLEIRPVLRFRVPSLVQVRLDPSAIRDMSGKLRRRSSDYRPLCHLARAE